MKIINNSERIYDLGKFQVPPGRRGTVVPEGCEELARKIVASFSDELELDEDNRDEKIAKLEAELEQAKGKKGRKAKAAETPADPVEAPEET